eukprot:15494587-Heterocapsa_arctica.AAC.1
MNEKGQNDIYYTIGENIALAFSSPFLETIRKNNMKGALAVYFADELIMDLEKIEAQPNYFIKIFPDKVN